MLRACVYLSPLRRVTLLRPKLLSPTSTCLLSPASSPSPPPRPLSSLSPPTMSKSSSVQNQKTLATINVALESLAREGQGTLPSDPYDQFQWEMAGAHGLVLIGLKNIYLVRLASLSKRCPDRTSDWYVSHPSIDRKPARWTWKISMILCCTRYFGYR